MLRGYLLEKIDNLNEGVERERDTIRYFHSRGTQIFCIIQLVATCSQLGVLGNILAKSHTIFGIDKSLKEHKKLE